MGLFNSELDRTFLVVCGVELNLKKLSECAKRLGAKNPYYDDDFGRLSIEWPDTVQLFDCSSFGLGYEEGLLGILRRVQLRLWTFRPTITVVSCPPKLLEATVVRLAELLEAANTQTTLGSYWLWWPVEMIRRVGESVAGWHRYGVAHVVSAAAQTADDAGSLYLTETFNELVAKVRKIPSVDTADA